jgi:hypothetical protein
LRLTPTYRCQQHGTDAIPAASPQVKGADVAMKCWSFSPSREKRVARPALTAEKVRWLNLED